MPSAPPKLSGMFDATISVTAPRSRERVENIPVGQIDSHPLNTTKVTEEMLDPAFRSSVDSFGVFQPVLLTPQPEENGRYYLLAGHKRLLATKLSGRTHIPAIVRKDLPPGFEGICITDTNLQYGVRDMLPSEKSRTLLEQYLSIRKFRKYCRLHEGESNELELGGKVIKIDHLEKTREVLAKAYGLTAADVQRYLELHQLRPALFDLVDRRLLAVSTAHTLAVLPDSWQEEIARCLGPAPRGFTAKKAKSLVELWRGGGAPEQISGLISARDDGEPPAKKLVYRVPDDIARRWFQGMAKEDVARTMQEALELYFSRKALDNSEQRGYNKGEEMQ